MVITDQFHELNYFRHHVPNGSGAQSSFQRVVGRVTLG